MKNKLSAYKDSGEEEQAIIVHYCYSQVKDEVEQSGIHPWKTNLKKELTWDQTITKTVANSKYYVCLYTAVCTQSSYVFWICSSFSPFSITSSFLLQKYRN